MKDETLNFIHPFSCKKQLFYLPCQVALLFKNDKNPKTGKECILPVTYKITSAKRNNFKLTKSQKLKRKSKIKLIIECPRLALPGSLPPIRPH